MENDLFPVLLELSELQCVTHSLLLAQLSVLEFDMTSRANHLDRFAIFSSFECSETELEMNSRIADD